MSNLRMVIDGRYFTSLEEYEAGLRDKQLITELVGDLNLNKREDIISIYQKLNKGNYRFESVVGMEFDDRIYEQYKLALVNPIQDGKKKSIFAKVDNVLASRKKSSLDNIVNIKDYDKDMKQKIAKELQHRDLKRNIVGLTCGLVAITCFAYISFYSKATDISKSEFERLAALKEEGMQTNARSSSEEPVKVHLIDNKEIIVPDILPEYKLIYEENHDLIGWIKIDNTVIDYPVMQSDDNEFYLNRNFSKANDKNGSIFMDKECDVLADNDNIILYGHHMRTGNMFGTLSKYKSESYMKEHSTITFDTIYEHGTYEVMYVFNSKVFFEADLTFKYYQFINATSSAEFYSAMNEMSKLSLYDTGVTATYGDRLLTLSTCDYQENKGRLVVVARKV